MDRQKITQDPAVEHAVPASIHALDALLNQRVLEASTSDELTAALRAKLDVKRRIMLGPTADVEAAARTWIIRLRRPRRS